MIVKPLLSRYTRAVVWRHYIMWRGMLWPSLATNVFNPILFLFAFGFGLGAFIDTMDGTSYLSFIVPGMVAYAAMFAASFETTIGAFSRYWQQRTWDAVLATPVSLFELLAGEALWATFKGMFSAICVLAVGAAWGGVPSLEGALLVLPIMFVGSMSFACAGLAATAFARGYEFFSYFFTFWVTPMFVFCGVFFEIERYPESVQTAAWLLPMTHIIAIVRPLMTSQPVEPLWTLVHLSYVVLLAVITFLIAYKKMRRRMFD